MTPQMKTMKRTISAMAASKYNVLHWHITDAQSFPLSLRNVPLLAEKVGCLLLHCNDGHVESVRCVCVPWLVREPLMVVSSTVKVT
jgi:hypothetical protein